MFRGSKCPISGVMFGSSQSQNDQEEAQLCQFTTEVNVFMDNLQLKWQVLLNLTLKYVRYSP